MSVTIKNQEEIEKMRVAGRLASQVLDMIGEHVKAGVSTDELNTICHEHIEVTIFKSVNGKEGRSWKEKESVGLNYL